jgi:hypothetical protein
VLLLPAWWRNSVPCVHWEAAFLMSPVLMSVYHQLGSLLCNGSDKFKNDLRQFLEQFFAQQWPTSDKYNHKLYFWYCCCCYLLLYWWLCWCQWHEDLWKASLLQTEQFTVSLRSRPLAQHCCRKMKLALAEAVVRVEALCDKTWKLIGSVQVATIATEQRTSFKNCNWAAYKFQQLQLSSVQVATIATDRNCTQSGRDH